MESYDRLFEYEPDVLEQMQAGQKDTLRKEIRESVWQKIASKQQPMAKIRRMNAWRAAASVAAVLLIVCAGWLTYSIAFAGRMITVSSKAASHLVALPDGSTITLNNGSKVSYSSNFNGSENGVVFSCNDFEIVGDVIVPKKRLRFPQFVVNGREYTSEMEEVERAYQQQFFDLHLDQIKSVRVQRLTGFLTTAPGIQVERVLIHLTVKEMPAEKGLLVTEVHGFDENAPYSQSLNRPEKSAYSHLVYWKPDIVTDEKGEATVTFLNSGPGDEIAYELNGVSPGGQMISAANYSEQ